MSVMDSLFLLVALSLCGLTQSQSIDELKQDALALGSNLVCESYKCDCTFNEEKGCCCGANDMFMMEDELYNRIKNIYRTIYHFKTEVQELTTNRKIAFHARMKVDAQTTNNGGLMCFGPSTHDIPISFGHVILNDGNGYNPVLGVFTAPKNGVYVFSFTIASRNDKTQELKHKVVFKWQGVPTAAVWEENLEDSQDSATQYVVLKLRKGEQVYLELKAGRKICTSFASNTFSGFLAYTTED